MRTALILGAGFSRAAGFPLTSELLEELPRADTGKAELRYQGVFDSWRHWKQIEPGLDPEEWLQRLYNSDPFSVYGTTWEDALDFVLARLVRLPSGSHAKYYHGVSTSVESAVHRDFWSRVRQTFDVKSVVTTNYDILIEQGLKKEYSDHRTEPLCWYGGHPYHLILRMMLDVTARDESRKSRPLRLGHEIALYKLHGSLNWVTEAPDPSRPDKKVFKIHEDVRAVFREGRERCRVLVVPPLTEKEDEEWLKPVWEGAESALADSQIWFICGYALHPRDGLIRKLLKRAASRAFGLRLIICDPSSGTLVSRWQEVVPPGTPIKAVPGVPVVLEEEHWQHIRALPSEYSNTRPTKGLKRTSDDAA